MAGESSKLNGKYWWSDENLRPVLVVVCTSDCNAIGYTYRLDHQRLLDALNEGITANSSHIGKDFVPLTDVKMFLPRGEVEYMVSTHIRKANILFVAEISGGLPEKASGKKLEKKPVPVKVRMSSYSLVGQTYARMYQQLVHTIEGDETFLPLTNVEITPVLVNCDSRFDFVAINKDKVAYVGESMGFTPSAALASAESKATTGGNGRGVGAYFAGTLYAVDSWLREARKQVDSRVQKAEKQIELGAASTSARLLSAVDRRLEETQKHIDLRLKELDNQNGRTSEPMDENTRPGILSSDTVSDKSRLVEEAERCLTLTKNRR